MVIDEAIELFAHLSQEHLQHQVERLRMEQSQVSAENCRHYLLLIVLDFSLIYQSRQVLHRCFVTPEGLFEKF